MYLSEIKNEERLQQKFVLHLSRIFLLLKDDTFKLFLIVRFRFSFFFIKAVIIRLHFFDTSGTIDACGRQEMPFAILDLNQWLC